MFNVLGLSAQVAQSDTSKCAVRISSPKTAAPPINAATVASTPMATMNAMITTNVTMLMMAASTPDRCFTSWVRMRPYPTIRCPGGNGFGGVG